MSTGPERRPDNPGPDTGQPWLSALDAAQLLGVHERTVRRAIARGALPATKRSGVWQIDRHDLDRLTPSADRRSRASRAATLPSLILLPQAPARPPFMVPQPRTPLIGRERDIASLHALVLDERAPLATLTGPGGSGKTRLAVAVAASLRDCFADGIWFVDLSAVRDADLVPGAIAQALKLRETSGKSPLDRLLSYLQSRTTLLVLDNVEQVIEAAPAIGQMLTACPDLQVIATSRVPLHLSAEHRFRVAPLDLPRSDRQPSREEVEAAPATRLFRQVARRVRSGFQLTDANAATVAALCARLDGLPLAIELAAAQSAVYTPETLLERLDHRLGVLDHGPHDAPPRLRSMRDAIGWSYDLLDERLQQRFRRLSVFDGGFTADAAAVVTSHPPLDPGSADDDLRSLVDANLVIATPEMSRYTMLETIRAFGQEQLENGEELESLREAHARWCHDLLARAYPHWFSPGQTHWGDLLEQEHANLRAALNWLHARESRQDFVTLVGLLWPYWFVRSHWSEGMEWLELARVASDGERSLDRLRILGGLCCLCMKRGDVARSTSFAEQALELSGTVEVVTPTDNPYNPMAICADARGDHKESARWNAIALDWLRSQADIAPNALPIASVILSNMAGNALRQGNEDAAERLATEALEMQRASGFDWMAADSLNVLARIAVQRGRHTDATTLYHECLARAHRSRDTHLIAATLHTYARLEAASGRHDRAALLLGTSDRLIEQSGNPLPAGEQPETARIISEGNARLGHDTRAAWWTAGHTMHLDEVITLAMEMQVPADAPQAARLRQNFGITAREHDVLQLLGDGLTDQEIADALFIGRRTVHTHVSRLLAKLGASNRREVVARARAERLLDDPSPPAAAS